MAAHGLLFALNTKVEAARVDGYHVWARVDAVQEVLQPFLFGADLAEAVAYAGSHLGDNGTVLVDQPDGLTQHIVVATGRIRIAGVQMRNRGARVIAALNLVPNFFGRHRQCRVLLLAEKRIDDGGGDN